MKKLYEKNELTFAIVWIAVYCVLLSLANPLNKIVGIEYSASAAFCILQAVVLFAFIRKKFAKAIWFLQIARSRKAVSLLCAAGYPRFGKSLERLCSQLFIGRNYLQNRVYALSRVLGGSDL